MTSGNSDPGFLVRAVARIGVSVRWKLLSAFLGLTFILIGLSLLALVSLQQANARSERMVHDQARIAYFNNIHAFVGDIVSMTLAQFTPYEGLEGKGGSFFVIPIDDRVNSLESFVAQGVRRFGRDGMPDAPLIADLRTRIAELKPVAVECETLQTFQGRDIAATCGLEHLFEPFRAMQRDTYTIVQDIKRQMQARARETESAYLDTRQTIAVAAFVAVGLALLVGYAMSSSLIWPIRRVGGTLNRLAGGDFTARVQVPNRDELGDLARDVNSTSEQLADLYEKVDAQKAELAAWNAQLEAKVQQQVGELERSNRLRRFLPPQVAELILEADETTDILATRKAEITVLFADMRGFTAFSNTAPPEQVVAALNTFHATCGPLIDASGGTLERFLGDGIMVLFGAPLPMEDAASRAVHLAMELRDAVATALAPFQSDRISLGFGIGIATGAATLGRIGSERRLDYSAIGPAPNLAARLCDQAGNGQIVLSQATVWQADVATTPVGPFDLKGIGTAIPAFVI